ncbi:MAG: carbohydrate kinase family protein [Sphaerochaetaceae bacterium]|jgi:fructokinase
MIAVIGESLIDFIGVESPSRGRMFESFVGGCGLNTATAIGRLGGAVTFFGGISSDMFGRRIVSHLVTNQVLFDPDLCNMPAPTTLGFASLDEHGGASYAFYCRGTAAMTLSTEQLSMSLSLNTDIRIVHIGSLSLVVQPVCDAILDSVEFLNPHPVVFFDPNVRPAVIDDFPAYRARFLKIAKTADIIKLSDEDLALMYDDMAVDVAVAKLRESSGAHVVLTRGKSGAAWILPDGTWIDCPAFETTVVDTVGAGDTFSGALLHFLQERGLLGSDGTAPELMPISPDIASEALRFASAAASINCSRPGCDPPTADELSDRIDTL